MMQSCPKLDDIFQHQLDAMVGEFHHLRTAFCYESLGSTNDQAQILEQQGAKSGTLVMASRQIKGRGRLNRSWFMAEGDIALSIILRPPFIPNNWALMPMIPAVAMVEALAHLSITSRLKWPNDIVIQFDEPKLALNYLANFRKVGGILIENVFRNEGIAASIVGIGLNIMVNPRLYEQVPHAMSLKQVAPGIDRLACLKPFLESLDRKLIGLDHQGFAQGIFEDYSNYCETLGRHVSIGLVERTIRGQARTIRADGSLVVNDGLSDHIILAGDVVGY